MNMRSIKNPKMRRYAVIAIIALMLASVAVLADVIYYYKGVITATVSQAPLTFYSGKNFTYTNTTTSNTFSLNGLVPGYANFIASPTGFTATIQLTNASYAYFYHALGLVVNTPGWLYVTNVTAPSSNQIIETLTITVQNAYTNQTVCSFTVINYSQPITSPTQACPLSTGAYFISVLVQPINYLSPGLSETVTLYFGYNVVSNATVPLPPISG
jgi:hypothetical protein